MGFMEMEFGATITGFMNGRRSDGSKSAKDPYQDTELKDLVQLIFTEEGSKVPYTVLQDPWWTPVLDTYISAARAEYKKPVIAVLARDSSVNATLALSRAVYAGDRLMVQALLASPIPIVVDPAFSTTDPRDGTLPLHRLCGSNYPQELLILAVVDVYKEALLKKDFQNRVPIHWACMAPDVDITVMKTLLSANSRMAGMKDDLGCLPMHYLAINGRAPEQAFVLLNSSYNQALSVTDNEGMLCLHHICAAPDMDKSFLQVVLNFDHGGNASGFSTEESLVTPDLAGKLPLHHICASKRVGIASKQLFAMVEMVPESIEAKDEHGAHSIDLLLTNKGAHLSETNYTIYHLCNSLCHTLTPLCIARCTFCHACHPRNIGEDEAAAGEDANAGSV
jgi:hypothetical protein